MFKINCIPYRSFVRHYSRILYSSSLSYNGICVRSKIVSIALCRINVNDVSRPNLQCVRNKYTKNKQKSAEMERLNSEGMHGNGNCQNSEGMHGNGNCQLEETSKRQNRVEAFCEIDMESCDVQKLWMGERQISEESSDSDSDDENIDDGVSDRNAKIVTIKVGSLRTDLIVKAGLSIARNKVENLFYESRIRVNGRKILKKSAQVHIGDEVDVIRGVSPMNPKFLLVSRLEILSMKGEEENINVKLRRFKSLTIENYTDTWKESTSSSES